MEGSAFDKRIYTLRHLGSSGQRDLRQPFSKVFIRNKWGVLLYINSTIKLVPSNIVSRSLEPHRNPMYGAVVDLKTFTSQRK